MKNLLSKVLLKVLKTGYKLNQLIFIPEEERFRGKEFKGRLREMVISRFGTEHVYYPTVRREIIGPLLDEYDKVILDMTGYGENTAHMTNCLFIELVVIDKRSGDLVANVLKVKNDFFPHQSVAINNSIQALRGM